jgi:hypothetical protein
MSFTVPQDIVDRLEIIFPKSKDRVKIAVSLLGYDHYPSRAEWLDIAEATGKDKRTVELVLERLVEENLIASELGSIPLWRVHEKERLASTLTDNHPPINPKTDDSIPAGAHGGLPIYSMDLSGSIEKEGVKGNTVEQVKENEEEVKKEPAQDSARGVKVSVHSDAQEREIKAIKVKQENFETVITAKFGNIEDALKKIIEQQSKVPEPQTVVPVVSPLKGQPKQPAAEDPVDPPNPGPTVNPNDPFAGMSKEQIIEFYENNPPPGRKLPGGLSETFVTAPPATIRKIMIEVTTYTQMLYEKALADAAFEGTFSDFLNWAPAKYFEDRGLSLGWHKVERHPGGRLQ